MGDEEDGEHSGDIVDNGDCSRLGALELKALLNGAERGTYIATDR